MAESYKIIAEQDYCTVVAKYESSRKNGNAYQSEQDLERWLIEQLQRQGYEYPSTTRKSCWRTYAYSWARQTIQNTLTRSGKVCRIN